MTRSLLLPAVAFGAVACLCPTVAPAQTKVGVINFQRAVLGTAEIKKASDELQSKFKPQQDELEKIQKDLAEIQAKLQDPKTTPAMQASLNAEGQRKQREAQRLSEDLQADVERARNAVLERAGQRLTEVVKKMADEKGLDVVIDSSNAVFFKPGLEVTEEAIAAYDRAFPVQ